ncbi:MAG: trypsin-like peptidase domain-containing protein [Dehalococcoidia bacterium]
MKNFKTIAVIKEAIMFIATIVSVIGFGFTLASHSTYAATMPYSDAAGTSIYDSANPAVVVIEVTRKDSIPNGLPVPQEEVGYGLLVDNRGLILTNDHIIDGASSVEVVLNSGNTVSAKVVSTDPVDDLALLTIDSSNVSGMAPAPV